MCFVVLCCIIWAHNIPSNKITKWSQYIIQLGSIVLQKVKFKRATPKRRRGVGMRRCELFLYFGYLILSWALAGTSRKCGQSWMNLGILNSMTDNQYSAWTGYHWMRFSTNRPTLWQTFITLIAEKKSRPLSSVLPKVDCVNMSLTTSVAQSHACGVNDCVQIALQCSIFIKTL